MNDPYPSAKELEFLNRILPLSDDAVGKLAVYHQLLMRWQAKTNLVGPSTLAQFWQRHVADSLQLYALYREVKQWTDLGSGGGFPGMVLAIMLADIDSGSVRLIESVQKKCAFLRKVANETGAAASIHPMRIESAAKQLEQAQIITARALASLDELLLLTNGYINDPRFAVFYKGRDYQL